MKTLIKVGIAAAVVAIAFTIVPALKGPYNRAKIAANDKLNSEFVVDNYKAEYIELHSKKVSVVQNIQKFRMEQKVTDKKLAYAIDKRDAAKKNLIAIGTSDINSFNRAKDAYETAKIEVDNFIAMGQAYSNAVSKLEDTLYLIETNMSKAKANVTALESKKMLVDSIKSVNKTVESINGVGDSELGVSIEKLDDDVLRESIKLEALRETTVPTMNKAQADAYLQNLK